MINFFTNIKVLCQHKNKINSLRNKNFEKRLSISQELDNFDELLTEYSVFFA